MGTLVKQVLKEEGGGIGVVLLKRFCKAPAWIFVDGRVLKELRSNAPAFLTFSCNTYIARRQENDVL